MPVRKPALTVIHIEDLEIAGRVYFGEPERTYGPPENCNPAGGDEVEDISVLRTPPHGGDAEKLSDEVVEKLGLDWEDICNKLVAQALPLRRYGRCTRVSWPHQALSLLWRKIFDSPLKR